MRKYFLILISFMIHACCDGIYAQTVNTSQVFEFLNSSDNFVRNPFARLNQDNVSCGGSVTQGRTLASSKLKGIAAHRMTGTASGAYCAAAIRTPTAPFNNAQNRCGYMLYYAGVNASSYALDINGVQTALENTASTDEFKIKSYNLPCSASPTPPRVTQVVAGSPGAIDYGWYYGPSSRLSQVSQATFYGGAQQDGGVNCIYGQNTSTSENNYVDLGSAGSCAQAWSSYGNCTAVGPTSSQITCANMPPGDYRFELSGNFGQSASGSNCNFQLSDSTNNFGYATIFSSGSGAATTPLLPGRITYTTTATRTFKVISSDSGASQSCNISNNAAGRRLIWRIWRFPTQTETVASIDNQNEKNFVSFSISTTGVVTNRDGRLDTTPTSCVMSGTSNATGTCSFLKTLKDTPVCYVAGQGSAAVLAKLTNTGATTSSVQYFGYNTTTGADSPSSANILCLFRDRDIIPTPNGVVKIDPPVKRVIRITSSQTYTPTPGVKWIEVEQAGGGGGGGGSGSSGTAGNGTAGSTTSFGTLVLSPGGVSNTGGAAPTLTLNAPAILIESIDGAPGGYGQYVYNATVAYLAGGYGAANRLGFAGVPQSGAGFSGGIGSGGAGGRIDPFASTSGGNGGGSGVYAKWMLPNPTGSYTITIGNGGTGGSAGTNGSAGGAGGKGLMIITEYFTSFESALFSGALSKVLPETPGALFTRGASGARAEIGNIVCSGSSGTAQNSIGDGMNKAASTGTDSARGCVVTFVTPFQAGTTPVCTLAENNTATRQLAIGALSNTGFTLSCTSVSANCTNGTIQPGISCFGLQ